MCMTTDGAVTEVCWQWERGCWERYSYSGSIAMAVRAEGGCSD